MFFRKQKAQLAALEVRVAAAEMTIEKVKLNSSGGNSDPAGSLGHTTKPEKPPTLYCSFCSKSQHEVNTLIAGFTAFICDQCVRDGLGVLIKRSIKNPPHDPCSANGDRHE